MTRKVFLTGDRSIPPEIALVFAASAVSQLVMEAVATDEPLQLSTGDNAGFEQGVRQFLEALNAGFLTVPTEDTIEGLPDWDARHELVDSSTDRVIFVHTDPLSSHIGASLMKVIPGEKLSMATLNL